MALRGESMSPSSSLLTLTRGGMQVDVVGHDDGTNDAHGLQQLGQPGLGTRGRNRP